MIFVRTLPLQTKALWMGTTLAGLYQLFVNSSFSVAPPLRDEVENSIAALISQITAIDYPSNRSPIDAISKDALLF